MTTRKRPPTTETPNAVVQVTDSPKQPPAPIPPALAKLAAESAKRYGSVVMASGATNMPVLRSSTGVFSLDVAMFGGWAERHMSLVYGWEDSGKSTMVARAIAAQQRKYPTLFAIYIDTEGHYDSTWFAINGVDLNRLMVVSGLEMGEQYVDVYHDVLLSGEVCIVVIDSIASIIPADTVNKSAEDNEKMAARAKIVNRLCSSFTTCKHNSSSAGRHIPMSLWVNQLRNSMAMYGDPTTLPGGNFQQFLAHARVLFRKPKITMGKDPVNGFEVPMYKTYDFKIEKAKGGLFFDKGAYNMVVNNYHSPYYNEGNIDDIVTVMTYAKQLGMLGGGGKAQTFVMFPGEQFAPANGKKAVEVMAETLLQHPEQYELCKASIIGMARLHKRMPLTPPDDNLCGFNAAALTPIIQSTIESRKARKSLPTGSDDE